jgi:predicted enzyme related to lactoylglutathione lyase
MRRNAPLKPNSSDGRAVGIGGVFFKAKHADSLCQWYVDMLGLPEDDEGVWFASRDETPGARTVFAAFESDSDYFGKSQQQFMINFRVQNLDALLERLREAGVEILPKREEYDYGRFAWIVDPEGNRVELWEPHE